MCALATSSADLAFDGVDIHVERLVLLCRSNQLVRRR